MKDIMIDIETPGKKYGCGVLSIGAAYFDRQGNIGDKFYACMGLNGFSVGSTDPETLEWWSRQALQAKIDLISGEESPIIVAGNLQKFIKPGSRVWGNGSVFDITILEGWFEMLGREVPWSFRNVRDVRTVVDLLDIPKEDMAFEGTAHNALDDAIHQIKYLTKAMKVFYERKGF